MIGGSVLLLRYNGWRISRGEESISLGRWGRVLPTAHQGGRGAKGRPRKILLCFFELTEKFLDKFFNSDDFINTIRILPAENEAVVHITKIGIHKSQGNTVSRSFDFTGRETSIRTIYFQLSFNFKVL